MISRARAYAIEHLKTNWINIAFGAVGVFILAWFMWATTQSIREANQRPERPFEFTQAQYEPVEESVCASAGVFHRPMGWRVNPPLSEEEKHGYEAVTVFTYTSWAKYESAVNVTGLVDAPLGLEGFSKGDVRGWVYDYPADWRWEAIPTPLPDNPSAGLWRYITVVRAVTTAGETFDHFHVNVSIDDC